ncbi:hypothetical protein AVEN_214045-1 [Araneus ventricosus]|uniref:Uncharacterized protein n=1 Tax=Araneus ventricosus TaxID=182803 RepID=A0A4Y2VXQ4_ARAVE|nr:hypothetical protein AVEN_214045-1 [Araneus ventricosus]
MKSTRTRAKNDVIGCRRSEPIILSDFLPRFYQGRVCKYAYGAFVGSGFFRRVRSSVFIVNSRIVDNVWCSFNRQLGLVLVPLGHSTFSYGGHGHPLSSY